VFSRLQAFRIALALLLVLPLSAAGQRGGGLSGFFRVGYPTLPYDGQFTLVRLRYLETRGSGWRADYPTMEQNLSTMLKALTSISVHTDGSNVHLLDDPELHKFPVAYLSEPGYWYPSEEEVLGLRTYLQKGGFLIVDDFDGGEWPPFERAIMRVLPGARLDRLDLSHPVFHSFFEIKSLHVPYPGRLGERGVYGEFLGIHEDNDPTRRLMVVINYNNDIGDYMEWSGHNWWPVNTTNEAYKFAINYIVYALSH
jgi:hypothetical protein